MDEDQHQRSAYEEVIVSAMRREAIHLNVLLQHWNPEGGEPAAQPEARAAACVASTWAAMVGAARRFVRDHASLADGDLKRLAEYAPSLVEELPDDLHLLWLLHYVDGYPLSVYATATGMTEDEALDDYRTTILALSGAVHARQ